MDSLEDDSIPYGARPTFRGELLVSGIASPLISCFLFTTFSSTWMSGWKLGSMVGKTVNDGLFHLYLQMVYIYVRIGLVFHPLMF